MSQPQQPPNWNPFHPGADPPSSAHPPPAAHNSPAQNGFHGHNLPQPSSLENASSGQTPQSGLGSQGQGLSSQGQGASHPGVPARSPMQRGGPFTASGRFSPPVTMPTASRPTSGASGQRSGPSASSAASGAQAPGEPPMTSARRFSNLIFMGLLPWVQLLKLRYLAVPSEHIAQLVNTCCCC